LKVTASKIAHRSGKHAEAGQVISFDGGITVACGEGAITLTGVLPEGKSRMSAEDFIRGRKVNIGDILN
jgi:methionyl-tRNA formyltransferase